MNVLAPQQPKSIIGFPHKQVFCVECQCWIWVPLRCPEDNFRCGTCLGVRDIPIRRVKMYSDKQYHGSNID